MQSFYNNFAKDNLNMQQLVFLQAQASSVSKYRNELIDDCMSFCEMSQ